MIKRKNGMNKKLSVIIPTYNGGEWIKETIESVVKQLVLCSDEVEFIVRDNASTDNTAEIIKSFNKTNSGLIQYYKRESKAIADINFKESIELSQGEYILLLGDDDLLFPGYLVNTLRLIKQYPETGLFYYNRIATSRDFKGASLKHLNPNSSFERVYNNVREFIRDYPSGPDFMSANVVRRDCIIEGFKKAKSEYYGVEWYSGILYGIKGRQCVSTFSPMILQRYPVKRYWDDRMLLYVIVGMDNMFKDLDMTYPGIHNIWGKYSHDNIPRFPWIVNCIRLNRALYKDKYSELATKLSTTHRIIAYILIKSPWTYYPVKMFYYLYRLWSIFNNIIKK